MALTDCPMCNTPLPSNAPVLSSCGSCGADLTRWNRTAAATPPTVAPIAAAPAAVEEDGERFNLSRGITGALLGALLGSTAMYGFYELAGFRFPLLGVGIGFLTGWGAKKMFKGTDHTLGLIAGGIALVSIVGTLYLMYGEFPLLSIISVVVGVSFAYRTAGHS